MKKIYISILMACLLPVTAMAQEQLKKEITLDKDFVPVEKKAVKKSALPKVLKPAKMPVPVQLEYSSWAEPTAVSTEIPTMLPYGYHTSHLFSKKRGYMDLGAGTQLNMLGTIGYRFVDGPQLKVDGWLQHNSTWNGRNTTKVGYTAAPNGSTNPLKQKFNDNVLGLNLENDFEKGKLKVGATFHVDNFKYYGMTGQWWNADDQTLVDVQLGGAWDGRTEVADHLVDYGASLRYNYAGYSKSYVSNYDGSSENYINAALNGRYWMTQYSALGADVKLDYLSRSAKLESGRNFTDDMTMITVSPYYAFLGENFEAHLGGNANFSFSDGAKLRLSPHAWLTLDALTGFALYVNASGGKHVTTMSEMAALSRYSDPMAGYENTFSPFDGEAGFKIGPFSGFKFKIYGGYGTFKHQMLTYQPTRVDAKLYNVGNELYNPVLYKGFSTRGAKVGAELNYKYRSLFELTLDGVFAPQKNEIEQEKTYSGYSLGLDRAKYVFNADLKLYPVKQLMIDLGFELRGKRRALRESLLYLKTNPEGESYYGYSYDWLPMDDVCNLTAGARYRFDKMLTLWVQTNNLLDKRWDTLYGMGAQKLGFMGGISLVF